MELKWLDDYLALIETGSFSAAAEKRHVSQPAFSRRIQQLEEWLGVTLSDGREVVLYCRSGRRSAMAGEKLAAVTGEPVEHLEGGMLAWEAAGQPVEKPQGQ